MAAQQNFSNAAYMNEFGRPIGGNVEEWFEYGVRTGGPEYKSPFCSKTQTLYILLFAIGFLIFSASVILPIVIGNLTRT